MSAPVFAALLTAALQAVPIYEVSEELRLGTVNEPLTRIAGFGILPGGSIVVGQPQVHEVWRFDTHGRLAARTGGEGRGPGEFHGMRSLYVSGDSVFVEDVDRTTVFHADTLVALHRHVIVPGDSKILPSPRIATLAGTTLVLGSTLDRDADLPVPILALHNDGGGAEQIAVLRRADALRAGTDPATGLTVFVPLPVHGGDLWAVLPGDSPRLAILRKPVPEDGRLSQASLVLLNLRGDTVRVLHFSGRARAARSDAYDRERERWVRAGLRGRPFTEAQVRRAVENALIRHRFQPLFEHLVAGKDGTIWLGEAAFGGTERRWLRYDRNGVVLGAVSLPEGDDLLAADSTRLWISRSGVLDEPLIVRLRLRGPFRGRM